MIIVFIILIIAFPRRDFWGAAFAEGDAPHDARLLTYGVPAVMWGAAFAEGDAPHDARLLTYGVPAVMWGAAFAEGDAPHDARLLTYGVPAVLFRSHGPMLSLLIHHCIRYRFLNLWMLNTHGKSFLLHCPTKISRHHATDLR